MRAFAVLPVKRFRDAKRRLAAGLDAERRAALAAAMLEDVLEAIGEARTVERTIVVSGDATGGEIASAAGADLLADFEDEGHVAAALAGISRAEAEGAGCVILLAADCPLLEARELDHLLTGVPPSYVGVVPDRHGAGTNALVLAPPGAIRPAFGEGSCARHLAAAREAGIPHAVEESASLALDLDTPADIVALARELEARPGRAPHTAKVLGL